MLDSGDLDAPVPGCVPWRLVDLAHRLGGIHRWRRAAVVERRPGSETADDAPTRRAALVGWFRDGADALLTTLPDTDLDTPCRTFGPRPRTAAFWFRRRAHETAVHGGDAAASQGGARPYGPELALDGIVGIVGMFFPRQVRLARIPPLRTSLALEPDEGGRWVLAGDGTTPGPRDAATTVSGPAEALLLLLWHRIALGDARACA